MHEIDVIMDPADFRWQIDNQDTQYDDARDMNVTYILFDGERFDGGHFKVHGAKAISESHTFRLQSFD